MNNYLPFYYDELYGYCEDNTISIKDKISSLDRMRNILVDLRDDIFDMTIGLEIPDEIEEVIYIIITKINRRIIGTNKTIEKLIYMQTEDPKHKYLDPENILI